MKPMIAFKSMTSICDFGIYRKINASKILPRSLIATRKRPQTPTT